MKINFKTGLRRIVLTLIGFGVLCALIGYCTNGLIFDDWKFISNVKFVDKSNKEEIEFYDFLHMDYIVNSYNPIYISDYKCYPYKQICRAKNDVIGEFENNNKIEIENSGEPKRTYTVKMPSKFQYFMWQVQDFLLIFLIASLIYGIYLLFEKIVIWIFKGFKSED